jgi:hypothetical protein
MGIGTAEEVMVVNACMVNFELAYLTLTQFLNWLSWTLTGFELTCLTLTQF